jgi:HK97 gp10 family phage protein
MADFDVRVEGLAQLRRQLRQLENVDALTDVRQGLKRAAGIVAQDARSRVPVRSGRARASIRAQASGNRALVVGGKKSVPYYGWLDFGGRTPRRQIAPWRGSGGGPPKGRFIYPAIAAKRRQVADEVEDALRRAIQKAGLA